jgi:hypothetical protein
MTRATADRPALDPLDADARAGVAGVFSRNSLAIPNLEGLLGVERIAAFPRRREAGGLAFVVGWGDKPSAARPRGFAARTGVPFVAAEDGFLRSAGSHRVKPPPISLVLDDEGIYYRAGRPSRLERLIRAAQGLAPARLAEAAAALDRVRREKLTKYNTVGPAAPGDGRPIGILLVDQVFGDQSIAGGLATAATFETMAEAALAASPAGRIAVKIHPDVLAGRARGYLLDIARRHGLTVIADNANPFDLLARADEVYTVSSQLGFEALVAGRAVTCFGVPFYAGWGLTRDVPAGTEAAAALARRGEARTLVEVFAAAYLGYPRYADPVTREPIGIGQAIDRLLEWRDVLARRDRRVVLVGAPLDGRLAEAAFGGGFAVERVAAPGRGNNDGREAIVLRWSPEHGERGRAGPRGPTAHYPSPLAGEVPGKAGRRGPLRGHDTVGERASAAPASSSADVDVSPGAGAPSLPSPAGGEGSPAASAWLSITPGLLRDDRVGRAFGFDGAVLDVAAAEALLAEAEPTAAELDEARAILARLAATAFERVAVVPAGDPATVAGPDAAGGPVPRRHGLDGRRDTVAVILTERPSPADAAVIAAARAAHPDAAVLAVREAARPGGPSLARRLLDVALARRAPLPAAEPSPLVAARGRVAAVHVLASSLALDALALGLPVTVHGKPLFAGWGFTQDAAPAARPRRLSLEGFVALAVVRATAMTDPASGLPARTLELLALGERLASGRAPVGPDPGLLADLLKLDKRLKAFAARLRRA